MYNTFEHSVLAQIYSPWLLGIIVNIVVAISATRANSCRIEFETASCSYTKCEILLLLDHLFRFLTITNESYTK